MLGAWDLEIGAGVVAATKNHVRTGKDDCCYNAILLQRPVQVQGQNTANTRTKLIEIVMEGA